MNTHTTSIRRTAGVLLGALALVAAWQGTPVAQARAARTPDIKVMSLTATKAKAEAGWGLELRAVVRNVGGGSTDFGTVQFALSKDARPGGDIKLPPDVPVIPLEAGKETVLPPTLDVPAKTPPGKYYVVACAKVPGKDGSKANDCLASKKQVQVLPAIRGHLAGQIVFDRASAETGSDWHENSSDHATVDVSVQVDGREEGWDVFRSSGSTWSYVGESERVTHPSDCEVTETGTSAGGGTLRQTGDQYEDDLLGSFAVENHSEISLLVGLRYDHTLETKKVPTTELGCRAETTVKATPGVRALVDLDLEKVQQTKKSIVYKVVGATDPYSNETEWDTVTGRLTLELK